MKAMVVSPVGGRVPPSRGVLQHSLSINGTRRDLEAEEVAAYLTKLRSLVPDMPRKRKLSKLEVIQRVIEYICDLQTTLEETNAHQEQQQPATTGAKNNTTTSTTTTTTTTTGGGGGGGATSATSGGGGNNRQPLQPLLNAATTTSMPMSSAAGAER